MAKQDSVTSSDGTPAEFVAGMRSAPFWPAMEGRAQALVYDAATMGDFRSPRTGWPRSTCRRS
jgi:hypothetical protein